VVCTYVVFDNRRHQNNPHIEVERPIFNIIQISVEAAVSSFCGYRSLPPQPLTCAQPVSPPASLCAAASAALRTDYSELFTSREGPTIDISPSKILMSIGSRSMPVRRKTWADMRQKPSKFSIGVERNMKNWNCFVMVAVSYLRGKDWAATVEFESQSKQAERSVTIGTDRRSQR